MEEIAFIVEGPDDETFFRSVLIPFLAADKKFSGISFEVIVSAGYTEADYRRDLSVYDETLIVRDLDPDQYRDPLDKMNRFCTDFNLHHEKHRLCIVIAEIESWYMAVGARNLNLLPEKFKNLNTSTENITKESFKRELKRAYPRTHLAALKQQLIEKPDIATGVKRNDSLRYLFIKVNSLVSE